jgi:hypothetical protein
MNSRRQFVKLAGTGILAAGVTSVYGSEIKPIKESSKFVKPTDLFSIGIAGFTFIQIPVDQAIEIMKRVGVTNLSLKDVYMPMNSTQEVITQVMDKFKAAGITVYTVGVVYMKTQG